MTYQPPEPDGTVFDIPNGRPHDPIRRVELHRLLPDGEKIYTEDKVLAAYEAGRAAILKEIEDQKMKVAGIP